MTSSLWQGSRVNLPPSAGVFPVQCRGSWLIIAPPMPAKIYSDKDADLNILKDKTLAVIGFGSQGHAHALNLKESGVKVIVGLYPGSKSIEAARKHGLEVFDSAEAVKKADIIFMATPD